jgi:hypothetical protein
VARSHIKVADVHCGHVTEKVSLNTFCRAVYSLQLEGKNEENVVTVIYRAY